MKDMDGRDWDAADAAQFETLLSGSLPEVPPDEVAGRVTPWKGAMGRVIAGIALTAVTLNFACLNYLLPAVGTILQLLGFRALRRENGWFRACFLLSAVQTACLLPVLALYTTVLPSLCPAARALSVLPAVSLILTLARLVCLWRGLLAVQRGAGLAPRAPGAAALVVWYVLLGLLALAGYSGLLVGVIMLAGYVLLLRSLYRLSKTMDEAGYALRPAPVRISDRCLALLLAFALLAGCACGYAFGGSYPMDWAPRDANEHSGVEEIKTDLAALGFPGYVLDDLTAEDILACAGAVQVVSEAEDKAVNDGRTVTTRVQTGSGWHVTQDTVYDVYELRITGVAVRLPGQPERWILFHHFLWTTDPGFYGTESLQLWPAYQGISRGWRAAGDFTGRVLCSRDGTELAADYAQLGEQTYVSSSIFRGEQQSTDVFAVFSMPRHSEAQRGYVAYPVETVQPGYLISSWVNYTHQTSFLQYPVRTAAEQRMAGGWRGGAFRTVQDALQFFPEDSGTED